MKGKPLDNMEFMQWMKVPICFPLIWCFAMLECALLECTLQRRQQTNSVETPAPESYTSKPIAAMWMDDLGPVMPCSASGHPHYTPKCAPSRQAYFDGQTGGAPVAGYDGPGRRAQSRTGDLKSAPTRTQRRPVCSRRQMHFNGDRNRRSRASLNGIACCQAGLEPVMCVGQFGLLWH